MVDVSPTARTHRITGLTNRHVYEVTILARNAVGGGLPTKAQETPLAPPSVIDPAWTVPGVPTTVTVTAGNGEATLAWGPPASNGGSIVTEYTVRQDGAVIARLGHHGRAYALTDLINDQVYAVTVTARNVKGEGTAVAKTVTPVFSTGGTFNPLTYDYRPKINGGTVGRTDPAATLTPVSGNQAGPKTLLRVDTTAEITVTTGKVTIAESLLDFPVLVAVSSTAHASIQDSDLSGSPRLVVGQGLTLRRCWLGRGVETLVDGVIASDPGGGPGLTAHVPALIELCRIDGGGNAQATGTTDGISMWSCSDLDVRRNLIEWGNATGAAIRLHSTAGRIRDVTITENLILQRDAAQTAPIKLYGTPTGGNPELITITGNVFAGQDLLDYLDAGGQPVHSGSSTSTTENGKRLVFVKTAAERTLGIEAGAVLPNNVGEAIPAAAWVVWSGNIRGDTKVEVGPYPGATNSGWSTYTVEPPPPPPPPPPGGVVVYAAGDIADAGAFMGKTADVVVAAGTTAHLVLTLGDCAYESGTRVEFDRDYHPSWGKFKAKTKPSPGNHEQKAAVHPYADGYKSYYFDAPTGPNSLLYHSYDVGDWHFISINSHWAHQPNTTLPNGSSAGYTALRDAMYTWLDNDLTAFGAGSKTGLLAYWHHPRFSTGDHGDDANMSTVWTKLAAYGCDIVLQGHDHNYERWEKMTSAGALSNTGIRSWIVGTGGTVQARVFSRAQPAGFSVARFGGTTAAASYGLLRLELGASSYKFQWVNAAGVANSDTGGPYTLNPKP